MHKDKTSETHHADEEPRLLRGTPYTSVTDNANSEARSKTSKTDGQTGAELNKALEERHVHCDYIHGSQYAYRDSNLQEEILTVAGDEDGYDETVDLSEGT